MEGQSCRQPFDCGTQFKCVGGQCVPIPECEEGDNGCTAPNECLEASPAPVPDPDTPNCGLGDPNTDVDKVKDCVFDCSLFCDEWDKISGNLTANTTLKDCSPDDACSNCRTCVPSEGTDDDSVQQVTEYYTDLINATIQARTQLLQTHQDEEDALQLEEINALTPIDDEIDRIQGEIDDLTPLLPDPVVQDAIDSLEDELDEEYDKRLDVVQEYDEKEEDMEKRHENELDAKNEYITQLQDELTDRLEAMGRTRGACVEMTVPSRPCYCPPYFDPTTEKMVNDEAGRECYLCNRDDGSWEYRSDLCTVSCTRCVVCDDGNEVCATVNKSAEEANDVCYWAQKKALSKCGEYPEEEKLCPYPQQPCEVTGPFPDSDFSWELKDPQTLLILQGGDAPLTSNTGALATVVAKPLTGISPGVYPIEIQKFGTKINGSARTTFNVQSGYVEVTGGTLPPPPRIKGRPKIYGNTSVGSVVEAKLEDVEVNDSNPQWEYAWFADNEVVMDPPGSTSPATFSTLTLTADLADKFLEVGIRIPSADINGSPTPYVRSAPKAIEAVADVYNVTLGVTGGATLYTAAVLDYSDLTPYRPGIDPISISWIDLATGQASGGGSYFYFDGPWAVGKSFYPVVTFINNIGETTTIQGPTVGPISNNTTPPIEDFDPTPPIGSVNISSTNPSQGGTITANTNITSLNGVSAGPFYQWYENGDLLAGQEGNTLKLTQDNVGKAYACEATIFDDYGGSYSFYSSTTSPVLNTPDFPTGFIYINGEPTEGETLTTINNIADLDGIQVLNYAWLIDGNAINGADKSFLKITTDMQAADKTISVTAYYTDDYNVDKSVTSNPTGKVVNQSAKLLLSVEDNIVTSTFSSSFSADLLISGPPPSDDGAPSVTSILWQIKLGSPLLQWSSGVGESPPASPTNFPGNSGWNGVDIECPTGWDCFKESLGQSDDENAPIGSAYHHKCPYPGYPELTFEESTDKECKALCDDYCYRWQYTGTTAPSLGDGTSLISSLSSQGKTTYILETCVTSPDAKCSQDWERNFVGIYRAEYPPFSYWECTCANPIGPKGTVEGGVEWSQTVPGVGPWELSTEIRYDDIGFPLNDCEGYTSPGGLEECGNRNFFILRRETLCGGATKSQNQRSFFITDNRGVESEVYHGYTLWPFGYRTMMVNQNTEGTKWYPDWSQGYNVPPIPISEARSPFACPGAPTQVAYYDIENNIFYSSQEIYDEIIETEPLSLTYVLQATFGLLKEGDPLYATGQMAVSPPPMPERTIDDTIDVPSVIGPATAVYESGTGTRSVVVMNGVVARIEADPTAWRFTGTQGSVSEDGFFKITGEGRILTTTTNVPSGSYDLRVQCNWKGLWSKSYTVTVYVS